MIRKVGSQIRWSCETEKVNNRKCSIFNFEPEITVPRASDKIPQNFRNIQFTPEVYFLYLNNQRMVQLFLQPLRELGPSMQYQQFDFLIRQCPENRDEYEADSLKNVFCTPEMRWFTPWCSPKRTRLRCLPNSRPSRHSSHFSSKELRRKRHQKCSDCDLWRGLLCKTNSLIHSSWLQSYLMYSDDSSSSPRKAKSACAQTNPAVIGMSSQQRKYHLSKYFSFPRRSMAK